ncbi:unnamed protein product [Macrosiphum euphorbiae]|uniref:Uncharacterized protein n=1 Tax=Macrosiphum euphorbiae TaxID=13131 RepID=A0AAV0X7N8_9HEMI|nr:unnamed protein product [Macrosiphum euphorbiae]
MCMDQGGFDPLVKVQAPELDRRRDTVDSHTMPKGTRSDGKASRAGRVPAAGDISLPHQPFVGIHPRRSNTYLSSSVNHGFLSPYSEPRPLRH